MAGPVRALAKHGILPSVGHVIWKLWRRRPRLWKVALMCVLLEWLLQVGRLRLWGVARGPWPIPVMGTTYRYLFRGGVPKLHKTAFLDKKSYGRIFSWSYFHKRMLSANCPFYLRRVLVTHWKDYDRSDVEQAAFGELLGSGLILVGNREWSDMRKLYQPAFAERNIVAFRSVIGGWSQEFAQSLLERGGEAVDLEAATQRLTFRIIGLFTLGQDLEEAVWLDELRKEMGDTAWPCESYGELWFRLLATTQTRLMFGPFQWWRVLKTRNVSAFERGHALLLRTVDRAAEARERGERLENEGGDVFQDLLSFMLSQKGRRFSREEIRHQAFTFLFAGHDTTTNLISWCLHLLAVHTSDLHRAQEEALAPASPRTFLRACLLETLRLYPSVPIRSRTLATGDVFSASEPALCPSLRRPDAVNIVRGTGVGFAINVLHQDPDQWEEPQAFRPGRFEAHTSKFVGNALFSAPFVAEGPLSYLPFGAGPRRCVGERLALLEAEEVCAAVLRQCDICVPDRPPPEDEMHLTMRSSEGIWLRFAPIASTPSVCL